MTPAERAAHVRKVVAAAPEPSTYALALLDRLRFPHRAVREERQAS